MLIEKISKDMVTAMKTKDTFRLEVLRMLKSQIQVGNTQEKPISAEESVLSYYKKLVKATEMVEMKDKVEYIDKIKKELIIIEEFIPKALSKEDAEKLVTNHLSLGNMGAIMKAVKEDIAKMGVQFDGKMLSEVIKAKLG